MSKKYKIILSFLFLVFVMGSCLIEISNVIAAVAPGATTSGISLPANTGLSRESISTILINILGWLLRIVGVVALIGFVISGLQYILAAGDDDTMKTAKKNMTYSIMGIAVALGSFIIVKAINTILSGATMW